VSLAERLETFFADAAGTAAPTPAERIARGFLALAAVGYGAAVRARNAAYDHGVLRARGLPCRVVSVGNLTVGGTGKTPTIVLLAAAAVAAGRRACVLLRGYRRESGGVLVVSDGDVIASDWRQVGDEAMLLAQRLPGVPVIAGADRVTAGKLAVERFRPEVIFLDDGFQHRRIHRDADLVLVDATNPFAGGRLLPRGRLREPMEGLRRAQAFLVTRIDQGGDPAGLCRRLGNLAPGRPIGRARVRPLALRDLGCADQRPTTELRGKRVFAVSGIANPASFHRTLTDAGASLVGSLSFRDHHAFDAEDRRGMGEAARAHGAEWIVTTEKDAVRLGTELPGGLPAMALAIGLEIVEGSEALEAALGVPVRPAGHG
jgi:tetraacyldisaccharide 4'-kinase